MRRETRKTKMGDVWNAAIDCVCSVAAIGLAGLAFWLFLVATPDQFTAEADLQRAQIMR